MWTVAWLFTVSPVSTDTSVELRYLRLSIPKIFLHNWHLSLVNLGQGMIAETYPITTTNGGNWLYSWHRKIEVELIYTPEGVFITELGSTHPLYKSNTVCSSGTD